MKNYVYSKTTAKSQQSFYLVSEGQEYYLFTQKFFRGVKEHFNKNVILNEAMDIGNAHNDTALIKTKEKLPIYIKYIENEYGIVVLNKTARKKEKKFNSYRTRTLAWRCDYDVV